MLDKKSGESFILANSSKSLEKNEDAFYNFDLQTFVNRIFTLNLLSESYNDLKNDISSNEKLLFDAVVESMVKELFPKGITYETDSPIKCFANIDVDLLDLLSLNQYKKYFESETKCDLSSIFKPAGILSLKNVLEYPIVFDNTKSFTILITTDESSRNSAEKFIQYLMYSILNCAKKGDVQFRCADKEKSGQSYGKFINLIDSNKLLGNAIYSNETDISNMLSELNQIAERNFSTLKGKYKSVYEYNEINERKIPVTVAVFCDVFGFSFKKSDDELKKVINNSNNSAISSIFLINEGEEVEIGNIKNQLHIAFKNNKAYLVDDNFKLQMDISKATFTDEQFNALKDKLNAVEIVDTNFQSHYDLNNLKLFSRDATNGLQIPFAFDDNNNLVDLEIGDVTPHALLSGSTGSGKSVTLHAIINQIMINYHPDDVEIWAIDYKAVEFGYYVNKRTPHITIIGQDNSEDFTFGLIDHIKAEYDRRKNLFVQNNCKDFIAYRKMFGKRSISRLLIVVDEFHNMTQAISGYMGEKDYKKILENLLSEMRAMGMSFLFCSQTIAAGLNGLTEKGRNQIGCRLSMKHQDITEIKETLSLSLSSGFDFESIKYLRQGELIYKKISNHSDTEPFSIEKVHVLYTEDSRDKIIDIINANIEKDYIPRDEIICKNSSRYNITEKPRHPISRFVETGETEEKELLTVYPGSPTSLKDSFSFELDEEAGNNILLVGENDSMRESIIVSSVLGFLIDPKNIVVASILDVEDSDNHRLNEHLSKIKSKRLQINYGYDEVMACIRNLKKLRPYKNGRIIYLWYGLNKLKNLIFLKSQDYEENIKSNSIIADKIPDGVNPLEFLNNALNSLDTGFCESEKQEKFGDDLDYNDCQKIIKNLEEYGSENNRYCFMIFNTFKSLKKSKIVNVDNYEYRIGLKMSTDDSYDLFGSSSFISKANDTTAVFYSGSKIARTLRPYLIPSDDFIKKYNERLGE